MTYPAPTFDHPLETIGFAKAVLQAHATPGFVENYNRVTKSNFGIVSGPKAVAKEAEKFTAFVFDTVWMRLDPKVSVELCGGSGAFIQFENLAKEVLPTATKENESRSQATQEAG